MRSARQCSRSPMSPATVTQRRRPAGLHELSRLGGVLVLAPVRAQDVRALAREGDRDGAPDAGVSAPVMSATLSCSCFGKGGVGCACAGF